MAISTRFFLAAIAGLVVSGCAELNSIHRNTGIPSSGHGRVISVDAKQRHLLILPEFENEALTKWRVCAEAAPDVFSAFAASGGAKGDKSGGEVSFGSAETAATIERTQTINLLRESFYRTCERYASGAINRPQFIIQAARDQRSMVAVLAIEQLTGAVRPKSTIISGPGTAASTISGADAAALVNDYNKRLKTAEAAQESAKKAVDNAKKDGGVCADGEKKDEAACTALNLTWEQSKKDVTAATEALNNAIKLSEKLVTATTASTAAGGNESGSGISQSNISSDNLAEVAKAVVRIQAASAINEPLMFCISYLTDNNETRLSSADSGTQDKIITACLGMLGDQQKVDNERLTNNLSGINFVTSTNYQSSIQVGESWGDFQNRLLSEIAKTNQNDLDDRISNFEKRAGIKDYNSALKICHNKSPEKCASSVKNRDIYLDQFSEQTKPMFEDALKKWAQP
jgi:hypothetical protein